VSAITGATSAERSPTRRATWGERSEARRTPDSSKVSRMAAATWATAKGSGQDIRAANQDGGGPAHESATAESVGSTRPPGKTDIPAANAIEPVRRSR
jgi:hypothetical protein